MNELLFRCVHGSHLYGLATPESDSDFYEVWTKKAGSNPWTSRRGGRLSSQLIDKSLGVDVTRKDLGTFLLEATAGVPQALEAMFAPDSTVELDRIKPLRAGFTAYGAWPVLERYLQTMKNFALRESWKHRRHALRLALNAASIRTSGRFQPTLSREERLLIGDSLEALKSENASGEDVVELAKVLFWR